MTNFWCSRHSSGLKGAGWSQCLTCSVHSWHDAHLPWAWQGEGHARKDEIWVLHRRWAGGGSAGVRTGLVPHSSISLGARALECSEASLWDIGRYYAGWELAAAVGEARRLPQRRPQTRFPHAGPSLSLQAERNQDGLGDHLGQRTWMRNQLVGPGLLPYNVMYGRDWRGSRHSSRALSLSNTCSHPSASSPRKGILIRTFDRWQARICRDKGAGAMRAPRTTAICNADRDCAAQEEA